MSNNLVTSKSSFGPAMPMQAIEQLSAWQGLDFKSAGDFTHRLTTPRSLKSMPPSERSYSAVSIISPLIATTSHFRNSANA